MGNERLLLGIIGVFGVFGISFFVAGGFWGSVGQRVNQRGASHCTRHGYVTIIAFCGSSTTALADSTKAGLLSDSIVKSSRQVASVAALS